MIPHNKLTITDFINKANIIHNELYDYSLSVYINYTSKMTIICKTHGEFIQRADVHLRGYGCQYCSKLIKKTNETVIADFNKKHKHKYDYSLIEYKNDKSKVKIICNKHGIFEQTPNNHKKGSRCPKCAVSVSRTELIINEIFDNIFRGSDKKFIKPLEIDLISDEHKLCIEYDGLMFHSFGISNCKRFNNYNLLEQNKNKHLLKTNLVNENGYNLLHIFENEFLNKKQWNIWVSIINKIIKNIKYLNLDISNIYISKINNNICDDFLEHNHLEGKSNSTINLGLFINNVLSQVLSGDYKENNFVISRLCNLTSINTSFDILFNYLNDNYEYVEIIIFLNKRYTVLEYDYLLQSGFTHIACTFPKAYKFKVNENILAQTCNINDLNNSDFRIIFDCGNRIYRKIKGDK